MIWVVEDDAGIRDIELYALTSTGFSAQGFAGGDEVLAALSTQTPELMLLDVMLPGIDGVTLLNRLRRQGYTFPIIMATAKGMEYDKIQSLDLGADDYLVKPFGMMEMVSRIRAVLRRCQGGQSASCLTAQDLVMDLTQHTVTLKGKPLALTFKEFSLLRLFLSRPGVAFTRDQLFAQVWGDDYFGQTRTLDMHIRTLRQKLGTYGARIQTVRNVGYRWEAQP